MTADNTATTHGFLFADLRDYTRFVESRGDDAAAALLHRYRALVRKVIGEFGGAEIRTEGDSFYVVFPSASSAVLGGLAILAAAAEATRTDPNQPLRVAIGVHAGETAETGEGPVGSAVNLAARVCAQARAGELLITDTVRSLTRTRLTVRFTPRGHPRLKGIREPISLFAVQSAAESIQTDSEAAGRGRAARMWTRIRARPAARWVVPGVAAAAVIIALVGATVLGFPKASSSPSGSGATSGSPPATAITSLPAMADVPFYRADDHRSSIYPGPGPIAEPQLAWQVQLDGAADFVPIVVDGKVIVADLRGIVRALDARTGEERWRFQTENGGGFAESAAAADGLIFVADLAGTLHGLDAATGAERWGVPLPNTGIQPLVADRLLYVGSSDGHAYGFDPATGQRRWDWEGPAGTQMGVSVVSDGVAYIGGGGVLYAIRLVDRAYVWPPVKTISTNQSVAVLAEDTIFMAALPVPGEVSRSELLAVDRATGKVRWRWSSPSGLQVNPSSIRDGIVYVVTTDDGVYALRDKGGAAAEQVWHAPVPGSGRPISLVGDILYVGAHEGPLIALSVTDGHVLWQTPPGMAGTTNPVVTGGMIFQVDGELSVIRGWAEPGVIALLPSPSVEPSASPAATQPPDPFAVVASFPWSQTGIQVPAAMDLGPDGRLYVLHAKPDASNPLVTIIDPKTGRPVSGGSWGRLGTGKGEFSLHGEDGNGPAGCIAVGPDRLVYVGDFGNGRVEVFKSDGTFVRQIGSQGDGPGQLSRIIACDVGPDGSVYTLDHDLYYLSKFDAKGNFIWRMLADPVHSGLAFQLHGFTIRPDGKILGFTDGTGQVLTIDPADGHIIGCWGTPGNEPGQISGSGEPSVDGAGNIYVFQYVPQAVQVFDPKGRLIGGIYEDPGTPGYQSAESQFLGRVFWPPPVFDEDDFGYSFGPDGLVKLKVSLPPG
jgi:outer membrane protein assembly factor BamB/class 3 adenylate cyclase